MSHRRDLTDQRFGRLRVVCRNSSAANGGKAWTCICDCGTERVIAGDSLKRGLTNSCGCLQREHAGNLSRTHTLSATPEYKAWSAIKQRCCNPKCKSYRDYGARGIRMHPAWIRSFLDFLADVGQRPSANHSIDRRDNSGDYEPGNCRWATPTQQVNNRRNNVIVEYAGARMTLSEAAKCARISRDAVQGRMRRGLPAQQAFDATCKARFHHAS